MVLRAWLLRAIVTAGAYFVAGQLALLAALPTGYAVAAWPAAGIALVAVSRWGSAAVLGVLAGSLAVNASTGDLVVACLLAFGAGMRAVVGVALTRRFVRDDTLTHGRDVVLYFVLAGPVACLIGASWATGVLWLADLVPSAGLPFTWFTCWAGDSIGVVLGAPIVLSLLGEPRSLWRPRLWNVAAPLALTIVGIVLATGAARRAQRERAHAELAVRAAVVAHALKCSSSATPMSSPRRGDSSTRTPSSLASSSRPSRRQRPAAIPASSRSVGHRGSRARHAARSRRERARPIRASSFAF
jgi:hypothetical protein